MWEHCYKISYLLAEYDLAAFKVLKEFVRWRLENVEYRFLLIKLSVRRVNLLISILYSVVPHDSWDVVYVKISYMWWSESLLY